MDERINLHTEDEGRLEPPFPEGELAEEIRLGIEELFGCVFEKLGNGFKMSFENGCEYLIAVSKVN